MNVYQVLVDRLAAELTRRDASIATAESCTGGWIAKFLTDAPGSSAWFEYGFVSYGNNAKTTMLGVEQALLEGHGAVSQQVAEAMVAGALEAEEMARVVREEVEAVPDGYRITARRPGVEVDGLEHRELPVFSFQFHPEARPDFARRVGVPVEGPYKPEHYRY